MSSHNMKDSASPRLKRRKVESTDKLTEDDVSISLEEASSVDIHDYFYTKQLQILGQDALRLVLQSDVLVSGLGGLGVEVAKNVILGGARSITLHDHDVCTGNDLSSQFYLAGADLGRNRAEASRDHLAELNPRVSVGTYFGEITGEFVRRFKVVVLTNSSLEEQLRISCITHATNIRLIIATTKGLFGQVFCDFGEGFKVTDTNGEKSASPLVVMVTKDCEGIVTCANETKHELGDGDLVTFSKVEGMTELNDCTPKRVSVLGPHQFCIGDTSNYSDYVRGGIVKLVKTPKILNFKPLLEAIMNPDFIPTDTGKPTRSFQLHLAFKTLHHFNYTYKRDPRPWNLDDAKQFLNLAMSDGDSQANNSAETIELLDLFSKVCSGNICPINSIIGGIVAQEVVKACSGVFTPIYQWLYFDAVECLLGSKPIHEADSQPVGNRYAGQVAVFGEEFQTKLGALKYFVIGAGSIGSELLKNFAMMGVGGSNGGRITINDPELIRKSDLCSQFLYRSQNLQTPRSDAAANAIYKINPSINIINSKHKIGLFFADAYGDEFFEHVDGVAVAAATLDSRKYANCKCVYYHKTLLEAGVSGTKGSTQVVIPSLTQSYSCSGDPEVETYSLKSIQICPSTASHVLQWACLSFDILFCQPAEYVLMFLGHSSVADLMTEFSNLQLLNVLMTMKSMLVDERPKTFDDCIYWARKKWQKQFVKQIITLRSKIPPNAMTTSGQQFWSDHKKCPTPLSFSIDNPLHLDYVVAASNLIAAVYGIPQVNDRDRISWAIYNDIEPNLSQNFETQAETAFCNLTTHDKIIQLLNELPSREMLKDLSIVPPTFDPEDDSNFHLDFIVAAANLRASNYGLDPVDRATSRLAVGDISPSTASTSSVVAGLLALELIKLTQGTKELAHYKNGFFNLALPYVEFVQPIPPWQYTYNRSNKWTIWDRFEVVGELTLDQFLEHFETQHALRVNMIYCGSCVLFSEYFANQRLLELRFLTMTQVLYRMSGKVPAAGVKFLKLQLVCLDVEGNDAEVPYVRYILPSTA